MTTERALPSDTNPGEERMIARRKLLRGVLAGAAALSLGGLLLGAHAAGAADESPDSCKRRRRHKRKTHHKRR